MRLPKLLMRLSEALVARRFRAFDVGVDSDVASWRIRGQPGCRFSIGQRCFVRTSVVFEREGASLSVGDRTFLGRGLIAISSGVSIGSDVMIAWNVTIVDHNSHAVHFEDRAGDTERWLAGEKDWQHVKAAPVVVRDKVWIGFGVIILKGVEIGEGAVVAAGSVVTKSVLPWTVVAGNPARAIRDLRTSEVDASKPAEV